MPELPEVETFKRYLDRTSKNQIIKSIKIKDIRVLNVDKSILEELVINNKFESSTRHGKYLLVKIGNGYLILHFGMTGDLKYYNRGEEEPKYSKVIFRFENGFNLAYISLRMFGYLDTSKTIEDFIKKKKLGPDAYKMNFDDFKKALKRRSAILKNALLNQSFVAGIGNIYSDEILFKTKLNPKATLDSLDEDKTKELFDCIKEVLEFGIEKQGDLNTYPDYFLIPHRKKEEYCPICNHELERLELSGRHAFYCPNCQKL
ncbi:MAG: Fpg/Nei family DNA glycosylase [Promethearchaeota archaeon]